MLWFQSEMKPGPSPSASVIDDDGSSFIPFLRQIVMETPMEQRFW